MANASLTPLALQHSVDNISEQQNYPRALRERLMASKRQRVGKSTSEGSISAASAEALAQSSDATYTRPKTRQRVQKAPPPLTVPNITEDAAERKRVLNVLAQRRYSTFCSPLPRLWLPPNRPFT